MIKIGRRGSLNGTLIVEGRQGHVAYPNLADNPVRRIVAIMSAMMAEPLDSGSAHFDPSNLEFTSVDVGNKTVNVIPAEARGRFNIRFNDVRTRDALKAEVEARAHAGAGGGRFRIEWEPSNADAFVTTPGPFVELVADAVCRGHRAAAEALDHGRHLRCPLHPQLLPGARIRPRQPHHARHRRARRDAPTSSRSPRSTGRFWIGISDNCRHSGAPRSG